MEGEEKGEVGEKKAKVIISANSLSTCVLLKCSLALLYH